MYPLFFVLLPKIQTVCLLLFDFFLQKNNIAPTFDIKNNSSNSQMQMLGQAIIELAPTREDFARTDYMNWDKPQT